jgi:phytoene synthase
MNDRIVQASEASIEQGSQSFAAAAKLFDRRTREDAVMLYAWCRYCDDIIDGQQLGHRASHDAEEGSETERLDRLKEKTVKALQGMPSDDAQFEALRRVVERNEINPQYPLQLLHGFEMDVRHTTYTTMNDTSLYCYHVAGVVGVMMAMIMGARDPETLDRASDLGMAFQLTNICRDIVDDAREGRCYLPSELLQEYRIVSIDPHNAAQRDALFQVASVLLEDAERYYSSAYCGLPDLPFRSAWAIASARRIYRAIGRKLLAAGPSAWDKRISTSSATKAGLVVMALGDVILTRFHRPQASRAGLFDRPLR